MAREDTFKKREKTVFDNMLEDPIPVDKISVPKIDTTIEETIKVATKESKIDMPKKKKKIAKKEKSEFIKRPNFGKKKSESISRSFTIPRELSEIIDEAVKDSSGDRITGSYGFIKTVATNGIIKELVEIGVLDEDYLKNLIDYYE